MQRVVGDFIKGEIMKNKKYSCHKCGMVLNKESIVYDISGDHVFCKWCAEKDNLKSQADPKCSKCNGDGYTIFHEHHTYPISYDDEIMCPCRCLDKVKEVQC